MRTNRLLRKLRARNIEYRLMKFYDDNNIGHITIVTSHHYFSEGDIAGIIEETWNDYTM